MPKTAMIVQADWLKAPLQTAVVKALGAENIKFVGGAVRDTLIGREPADIDAATPLLPADMTMRLEAAGLRVIPTGLKHGTVTVALKKRAIEITTLRVDVETDGRRAEVAFTEDWLEDAKRRDFTFNAIYMAPDGTLFDPFNGLADLKAGTVRFIGDAVERIEEDALRILRFFRFFARYGQGKPNTEALAACTAKKTMLARLSIERIRDELFKMMALDNILQAVVPMWESGILAEVYGSKHCIRRIKSFLDAEKQTGATIDPLLRFYHLAPITLKAPDIASQFRLSNEELRFLCDLECALGDRQPADAAGIRRAIYTYGKKVAEAAAVSANTANYHSVRNLCSEWDVPYMPVMGRDLIATGAVPGPAMGARLQALEKRWIDSDFTLDREALLQISSESL